MFKTLTTVDIRLSPSIFAEIAGQVDSGQMISIRGRPRLVDGWIWHQVAGGGDLWIPERRADAAMRVLQWEGPAPLPVVPGIPPVHENTVIQNPPRPQEAIELARAGQKNVPKPTHMQPPRPKPQDFPQLPPNVDIFPGDYERTYRASLAITRAFEGGGFDSYQTYDQGIVSYGIMQFTLGSSLPRVLELYLESSQSEAANALRSQYLARVQNADPALRDDQTFEQLLKQAAQEQAMQEAQLTVAREDYWDVVIENYVQRRGNLRLPLTYALLFDMGIHFGVNHPYARYAEEALGVPANSRPGENGITEQQLTRKIAELRREAHYKQAEEQGLGGLKVRGDFWVRIVAEGDWGLQGDANGFVYPKSGVQVQVRDPF